MRIGERENFGAEILQEWGIGGGVGKVGQTPPDVGRCDSADWGDIAGVGIVVEGSKDIAGIFPRWRRVGVSKAGLSSASFAFATSAFRHSDPEEDIPGSHVVRQDRSARVVFWMESQADWLAVAWLQRPSYG